jgi:hypothetical protein
MYKGAGIYGYKALLNRVPIGQSGNNGVSHRLYIENGMDNGVLWSEFGLKDVFILMIRMNCAVTVQVLT